MEDEITDLGDGRASIAYERTDPMPDKFASWGAQWRERNPEWEIIDWTSWGQVVGRLGHIPPLVWDAKKYYPRDHKRFEADVLRLAILKQEGGIYVDTDVEPGKRNLDVFLANNEFAEVVVGRSPQHIKGHHPITNCVIAASPHNHFIQHCIGRQVEDAERYHHRTLAQSVGPWNLTRVYESYNEDSWVRAGVWVYGPGDLFDGTYFTHHWNTARRKAGKGLG